MMKKLLAGVVLSGLVANAAAGVVIVGTRVVYPAEQKAVGVQVKNTGSLPALVQVWLDNDKDNTNPIPNLPFTITPNVSRINVKNAQTFRIKHNGAALPQDRESIYYFNLLDVPAKTASNDKTESDKTVSNDKYKYNFQLQVQSRIKFFYRPAKLPYPVSEAYGKVTWHLAGNKLTVKNPTPYYITYGNVLLKQDKNNLTDVKEVDMIAPFSEQSFTVKKAVPQANKVEWHIINDYGGYYGNESTLQR